MEMFKQLFSKKNASGGQETDLFRASFNSMSSKNRKTQALLSFLPHSPHTYEESSLKKYVKLKSNRVGKFFFVRFGYVEKNAFAKRLATNLYSNSTESEFCCRLNSIPRGGLYCLKFLA